LKADRRQCAISRRDSLDDHLAAAQLILLYESAVTPMALEQQTQTTPDWKPKFLISQTQQFFEQILDNKLFGCSTAVSVSKRSSGSRASVQSASQSGQRRGFRGNIVRNLKNFGNAIERVPREDR
jgi:hypothetical protein